MSDPPTPYDSHFWDTYWVQTTDDIAHLKEGCVLYMANKPVNFPGGHK